MKYTVKPYMKEQWGKEFDPVPNPHWKCITCGQIKRSEIYIILWDEYNYETDRNNMTVHEYACSRLCADMFVLRDL